MTSWLKLLVTIALTISIPMQAYAGIVMSSCDLPQNNVTHKTFMEAKTTDSMMKLISFNVDNGMIDKSCSHENGNKICFDQQCSICHITFINIFDTKLLLTIELASNHYTSLKSDNYQNFPPGVFHPPKSQNS